MILWPFVLATGVLFAVLVFLKICKDAERSEKSKIYVNPENGRRYKILYDGTLKCPETSEWQDCIIYRAMDDRDLKFVRTKEDFCNNFIKLEEYSEQTYAGEKNYC